MISKLFMLLSVVFLTGCPDGYVREKGVGDGEEYCGMVANVSQLLDVYVKEKDGYRAASVVVPNSPVQVDVESDVDRSIHRLADPLNNQATVIRSVLKSIVVMRNMAPCNQENLRQSWTSLNKAIDALTTHYGECDAIQD